MAGDASDVEGLRQRLQRCVKSSWEDEELYRRIATKLDQELPGLEAFVVDDTGFAKKGAGRARVTAPASGLTMAMSAPHAPRHAHPIVN